MLESGEEKEESPLLFEVISAYICEKEGVDKRFVIYTIQVRHISGRDDSKPATIERRYTDFLNLYNGIKKDYPELMSTVVFPKKVLTGNFDNKLITTRSSSFEQMLRFVATEPKLRETRALLNFLQENEYLKCKELILSNEYSYAASILENQFRLLNNVYTDRSPPVLFTLCRLLGCSVAIPGTPTADKWADLALHRFEGVSDTDLLELYLPLLHVCIKVWWVKGRDKEALERRFLELRRKGMKLNDTLSLLDAVDSVEKKLYKSE
ncbi:sorting nexin-21 [Onthophagus taurus]|uniref:sorting nexin-21 n=1 Tax=Onthophagus taurus TaxID=166361 RepID=UPI000C200607|nr:sorting nexin-21 [Onthophagus taurus]